MIKRDMTIGRAVGILDRVVTLQLGMTRAAHGDEVPGQVLAHLVSIVVSNNLLCVNSTEAMGTVWELIEDSSSASLPTVDFLNAVTMMFYMRFHGEAVQPEEIVAFGTSCLHAKNGKSVLDAEYAADLPKEGIVELYRDNRWFVVLILLTMSSIIEALDGSVPQTNKVS